MDSPDIDVPVTLRPDRCLRCGNATRVTEETYQQRGGARWWHRRTVRVCEAVPGSRQPPCRPRILGDVALGPERPPADPPDEPLPQWERDLAPAPEPPISTEDTMSTTLVLNPGTPEEEALAALAIRPCADCGADLTGRHHKARYCLACRKAHDEDAARRRSEDRRRQTSRPAIIACETCGVDVLVHDSGPVPRYCPDCRGSRKAEPCPEPAPPDGPEALTRPEAEAEPELPVEEIHEEADADDSHTLPDMAAQLLKWMPHLLALPEEVAILVVRVAQAELRRRSA